jgi:hypothetical protein
LFEAAQGTRVGIELRHMLKKGQIAIEEEAERLTPAARFYALAALFCAQQGSPHYPLKFGRLHISALLLS